MKVQRLTVETMKIKVYTKAPIWWTEEEWNTTSEEREKVGIKMIDIEYNTDTSAQLLRNKDEDIVRPYTK